ncbi:hypothetical protein ABT061_40340 [Streptosporangium sp. NPDC002544]|uniref:hypothetical protein n=1 Tax=Streptosporangium sp. NPDC002544 TaxID=3154538 RepID=UPI0033178866
MSVLDLLVQLSVLVALSAVPGSLAVFLARRAGKSTPAALLLGLTVTVSAMGGFSALL